jgi:hypothetical protein
MCDWWDLSGGLSAKVARHKNWSKDYTKSQGSNCKTRRSEQRGGRGVQGLWAFQSLGARMRCKTEREDRGDRDGVLTSVGDKREVAGFRMVTDGWPGGQQIGTTKLPATWASRGMSEARDGKRSPRGACGCAHQRREEGERPESWPAADDLIQPARLQVAAANQ